MSAGESKDSAVPVWKTFEFPLQEPKWPFISELWAMRRLAYLTDRINLKGPESATREQIDALAGEFGFVSPTEGEGPDEMALSRGAQKQTASLLWRFKTSFVPSEVRSDQFRKIGAKLFRSQTGKWIDTRYKRDMPTRAIEYLSDDYFTLLKNEPVLGPYLALGPAVVVVRQADAIRVSPRPGKTD